MCSILSLARRRSSPARLGQRLGALEFLVKRNVPGDVPVGPDHLQVPVDVDEGQGARADVMRAAVLSQDAVLVGEGQEVLDMVLHLLQHPLGIVGMDMLSHCAPITMSVLSPMPKIVRMPASQSAVPAVKSASNTPIRETSSASLRRRDIWLSASSEALSPGDVGVGADDPDRLPLGIPLDAGARGIDPHPMAELVALAVVECHVGGVAGILSLDRMKHPFAIVRVQEFHPGVGVRRPCPAQGRGSTARRRNNTSCWYRAAGPDAGGRSDERVVPAAFAFLRCFLLLEGGDVGQLEENAVGPGDRCGQRRKAGQKPAARSAPPSTVSSTPAPVSPQRSPRPLRARPGRGRGPPGPADPPAAFLSHAARCSSSAPKAGLNREMRPSLSQGWRLPEAECRASRPVRGPARAWSFRISGGSGATDTLSNTYCEFASE